MDQQEFYISVGEPWDFESQDGQNIIKGKILKIINSKCLIYKTNQLLDFKGEKGNVLILYPRHVDSDFSDLNKGADFVTINGSLLLVDYMDDLDEQELNQNSKYFIIGAIRKEI